LDSDAVYTSRLMGTTGSGKTTFTNLVSGSSLPVGTTLESSTKEIQFAKFELDGEHIVLIDTPGFDNTDRSQADVLNQFATFLERRDNRGGARLSGVIYLHRISDNRIGRITMDSYRLFQKLCGNTSMSNVVITTTMWASVTEPLGRRLPDIPKSQHLVHRESVKSRINARLHRHIDTAESARNIIRDILHHVPRTLLVQQEMVDQHKPVPDTQAGNEL
ncbi:predicted protein, partial [Postia placenta Mad-698-R]